MKKNPIDVLLKIKRLVEELELILNDGLQASNKAVHNKSPSSNTAPKGAMGSIEMLIEGGYLDIPRDISWIMEKLRELGHYHQKNTISMNLFNLTKRRVLNRFQNKETRNWEYVIRR